MKTTFLALAVALGLSMAGCATKDQGTFHRGHEVGVFGAGGVH